MKVAPYVPGVVEEKVQDEVDVPPDDNVTLEGQVPVRPDGVETLRPMVPERPNKLVRVTVLVPEEPEANEIEEAVTLKSVTVTPRIMA